MIYMVDHVFAEPAAEPAWHAWYSGYLRKLVAVPGLHTAQRFKAIGCTPSRYLAMYSIDSADVYASDAYRNMGGGGSHWEQSQRLMAGLPDATFCAIPDVSHGYFWQVPDESAAIVLEWTASH